MSGHEHTATEDGTIRPVIGITADADAERFLLRRPYFDMVTGAGGVPVILPPLVDMMDQYLRICDGIIFSGGDDPDMTSFGEPTHPQARPIAPDRQQFELALLARLEERPDVPVLGICLGMQLMGLHAGGRLDQYLPEVLPTADRHWGKVEHTVSGDLGEGIVYSHHRQALNDAGRLRVVAQSSDGVIEAIRGDGRPFYLGVQWHPERTRDDRFGADIFASLIEAARRSHTGQLQNQ